MATTDISANSNFTVETLMDDGTTPQEPTLVLGGRAMPYQNFEVEGTMRAEFTWYPGNGVATVQMLGAQEKATVIKGMWKDKFIRSSTDEGVDVNPDGIALWNGTQVGNVQELVKNIDSEMRLAGRLLRVSWSGILRIGILTRFKQIYPRIEDVEWEMEFQWISRGEIQTPPSLPQRATASDFADEANPILTAILDALDQLEQGIHAATDWLAIVTDAVATIEAGVAEIVAAVEANVDLINSQAETIRRTLNVTETIKGAALTIVEMVESTPPFELLKTDEPEKLDMSNALLADSYARNLKALARSMQALAASQGEALRANVDQDIILAVFVARAPMDLREVSQQFYNTPNEWRRLMDFNALDSSFIPLGELILVPKITTTSEGA